MEPSGEEKFYELNSLITNLGGPIKSRYINLELKLEGQAGDFEKILEMANIELEIRHFLLWAGIYRRCPTRWFRKEFVLILVKLSSELEIS